MPIYEYRCTKGHTFDVMQRMSDDPIDTCQVCGKPASRVFHPPAVHFKGSGFYNTDYGTRKRSREKESSGEGSGDSSTATKSESKESAKESKGELKSSESKDAKGGGSSGKAEAKSSS